MNVQNAPDASQHHVKHDLPSVDLFGPIVALRVPLRRGSRQEPPEEVGRHPQNARVRPLWAVAVGGGMCMALGFSGRGYLMVLTTPPTCYRPSLVAPDSASDGRAGRSATACCRSA